jgi:acyl-coenzyme A thioesterase PaaI-like protein
VSDDVGTLSKEQLEHLAQYFNEEVTFSKHIGAKVEEVEPGRSVIYIDVEDVHLNGVGTLHFLGAVSGGRITCESEVVHRTRRTATAEAKVRDADGNLVAMGTGAFRVFEKKGNAIV